MTLGAFVVLPSKSGGKGNARLLGSVVYEVGEATVRLLRGQTVSEDLSLVRKTGEREVVVGKISIAVSLVGVGDAVDTRNVSKDTRVVDVIVHGASKLKRRNDGGIPTTWVEARIITEKQASLIAKYEQLAISSDPGAGDARKEIEKVIPDRKAETRAQKGSDPSWNEVMSIAIPDRDITDGTLIFLIFLLVLHC